MHDHLPKAGKPAPPAPSSPPVHAALGTPEGRTRQAGDRSGPPTETIPGTHLAGIHARVSERTCSTCREDLAVPEMNYRLVLRCSSARLDH